MPSSLIDPPSVVPSVLRRVVPALSPLRRPYHHRHHPPCPPSSAFPPRSRRRAVARGTARGRSLSQRGQPRPRRRDARKVTGDRGARWRESALPLCSSPSVPISPTLSLSLFFSLFLSLSFSFPLASTLAGARMGLVLSRGRMPRGTRENPPPVAGAELSRPSRSNPATHGPTNPLHPLHPLSLPRLFSISVPPLSSTLHAASIFLSLPLSLFLALCASSFAPARLLSPPILSLSLFYVATLVFSFLAISRRFSLSRANHPPTKVLLSLSLSCAFHCRTLAPCFAYQLHSALDLCPSSLPLSLYVASTLRSVVEYPSFTYILLTVLKATTANSLSVSRCVDMYFPVVDEMYAIETCEQCEKA